MKRREFLGTMFGAATASSLEGAQKPGAERGDRQTFDFEKEYNKLEQDWTGTAKGVGLPALKNLEAEIKVKIEKENDKTRKITYETRREVFAIQIKVLESIKRENGEWQKYLNDFKDPRLQSKISDLETIYQSRFSQLSSLASDARRFMRYEQASRGSASEIMGSEKAEKSYIYIGIGVERFDKEVTDFIEKMRSHYKGILKSKGVNIR